MAVAPAVSADGSSGLIPASPPRGEGGGEVGQQLRRRIFLEEVAGALDPEQFGVRKPVVQPLGQRRWKDAVFAAQMRRVGNDISLSRCSNSAVAVWSIWLY